MFRTSLPIFSICLLVACAAPNSLLDRNADKETGSPPDTAEDLDETDINENDAPTYWSVDGSLRIEQGDIVLNDSFVTLHFWKPDEKQCSVSLTLTDTQPIFELRPDPTLYGWWGISFTYPEPPNDCPWKLKGAETDTTPVSTLYLGIGPFDSRLDGALSASGINPNESSTHALFLSDPKDSDSLLVFGVAGTESQYTSTDGFEVSNPLQSATYRLTALYLFPY